MNSPRAILITAPTSGSGKTTFTLGLLRHFSEHGLAIRGAKCGPDYIDPTYHAAACGQMSVNLDSWSMDLPLIHGLAYFGAANNRNTTTSADEILLIEGAMGAIDGGGRSGKGSAADVAEALKIPVILVVDSSKSARSSILPVLGLQIARPNLQIAGIIANQVASERHAAQIKAAAQYYGIRVFGMMRRQQELNLPSRHLGLVPASEKSNLIQFMDRAADAVKRDIDCAAILSSTKPLRPSSKTFGSGIPPLNQRIAIAQDDAFCFIYPHLLSEWHRSGVEIRFFSPLADEQLPADCNAVFLPGGYPELHAEKIAAANNFGRSLRLAADRGAAIYGECGGYMVLGKSLETRDGRRHRMLELLSHSTSFKNPKLHLGYRNLKPNVNSPFSGTFAGHEFHYASISEEGSDERLFQSTDADGNKLQPSGGVRGSVSGSFAHLICARGA